MALDISFGQMESSTLVNSKKTNAMAKGSSSGKMAESMKVAGSRASNLEKDIIRTTTEKKRREFGWMANARSGSTIENRSRLITYFNSTDTKNSLKLH